MSIIRSNIVVSNLEQLFCKSFKAVQLLLRGQAEEVSPAVRQERLRQNKRKGNKTLLEGLHVGVVDVQVSLIVYAIFLTIMN